MTVGVLTSCERFVSAIKGVANKKYADEGGKTQSHVAFYRVLYVCERGDFRAASNNQTPTINLNLHVLFYITRSNGTSQSLPF